MHALSEARRPYGRHRRHHSVRAGPHHSFDKGPPVVQGAQAPVRLRVALHRIAYLLYAHRERLALGCPPGGAFASVSEAARKRTKTRCA